MGARAAAARRLRKRAVVAVVFGLLAAGTAGAYVPTSGRTPLPAPQPVAPAPSPEPGQDFDRLLAQLDEQENRLEAEIEESGPRLELVRRRMIARGRQYFRLVRAGLLPVGGGFDSLVDHASRVEQLHAALTRDIATERNLTERLAAAGKELRRVRAERAPLAVHREAMARARVAMQQAEERRAAFQRAFGDSAPLPHLAIYGADTGPVPSDLQGRFASMKGRLSFPLAGRAEMLTSHRPDPGGGAGLELLASRDTAVRAVYPGRVAFAGQTDHGMTVVLDHGDDYFTLYGNLQRLEVKVGDALPERGRLGWVLRRGAGEPALYFELRSGSNALNAAPWLGL